MGRGIEKREKVDDLLSGNNIKKNTEKLCKYQTFIFINKSAALVSCGKICQVKVGVQQLMFIHYL